MKIQRTEHCDIAIIGGGPAGVCAAIASARKKRKVILVEKYGFLGGVGTTSLFSPWRGFYAGQKKVIAGIADEIVENLVRMNGSPGHVSEGETIVTPFDSEALKYVLQEMVVESGVELLLHSEFIDVKKQNKRIEAVILHCREGMIEVQAKTFIDATGVGDVAVASNVKYIKNPTAVSYRFSMTNVDTNELFLFARDQKQEFSFNSRNEHGYFLLTGFSSFAKAWFDLHPELSPASSIEVTGESIEGNVIVSMIRIPDIDPSIMESMSNAGLMVQILPSEASRFLQKQIPGFSKSRILVTPPQFGFHAPRRIEGIIPLTYAKIMSGDSYYDSVGTFSLPGSIHATFQVSKRSMLAVGVENLLVTGRAILPLVALYSTNNQPASMRLGESAGTIAASIS